VFLKPSAVYPVARWIHTACVFWLLLGPSRALAAPCAPSHEIEAELGKIAVVVSSPSDFDQALAALAALRERYPNDLWVNQRYQDMVQQYGIEGHLRKLTEDYQVLSMQYPDDVMYSYLYARTLMGRNTSAAIQQMTEMVTDHPDFAPAHGALAEIYASPRFHDQSREEVERDRLLALCPGSRVQQRPSEIPAPSPLLDQAEGLLAQNADPDRVTAMAEQSVRDDEWRLQRIRPFDWYTVDYKRQVQRELQMKYWRLWSIEVRCYRRTGQLEKATVLLSVMDKRAALLRSNSDAVYWDAFATLAVLYEEGKQKEQATQKLKSMQDFLMTHPDTVRSAQLEELQRAADRL
jgi:hypothetical protein